jgi:hypothetical protein
MNIPLDAKAALLDKMAEDYAYFAAFQNGCPRRQIFTIVSREEDRSISRDARIAAMKTLGETNPIGPITKLSFDTRRTDQEHERNPRRNLQYYHRADEFLDEDTNDKLNKLSSLMRVLVDIKRDFGAEPEWFDSYARQLYSQVERALRVKQGDLDIHKPQLSYLEQLIYARYRLTMDDLKSLSGADLRAKILKKDEALVKRGSYLKEIGVDPENQNIVIDNNTTGNVQTTQESIVNAIFGSNNLRKGGERTVERTITIKIVDNVID